MTIEMVLTISNLLMVIAVLFYFYFQEVKQKEEVRDQTYKSQQFFREMNNSKDLLYKEISLSKDKLTNENLIAFLKHIKNLEEMVLPKPITKGMVDDIMLRTPPLVENEIDKDVGKIDEENFMDVFSKIPLDGNTKVAFEGELNEIEENQVPEQIG